MDIGINDGLKAPDYPDDSLTKLMHRINDVNEYAIRVIRLNRHYDDLLATRDSPADLLLQVQVRSPREQSTT